MITDQDLARIKAYCEKAPQPEDDFSGLKLTIPDCEFKISVSYKFDDREKVLAFQSLQLNAKSDLSALVEEVERLKLDHEELEQKLLTADSKLVDLIVRAVDAEAEVQRLKTAKDDNRAK